ncbi:hypothetical protein J7T55_008969 [Diaporthe amygdali]|uniref:uncharacterized protein n=1 Tax=Phomopsis amygdali TaxID=1214568 RepID=UPI0022FE80E7|nr:uncharacterized protein J7T55_008969 [Diaporthe amygdali]KAJ0100708.1 hypothetical protein J7T55_008969 [Diaporthe amygdali]
MSRFNPAQAEALARQIQRFHEFCRNEPDIKFTVQEEHRLAAAEVYGSGAEERIDYVADQNEERYPANEWTSQAKIHQAGKKIPSKTDEKMDTKSRARPLWTSKIPSRGRAMVSEI